LQHDGANVVTVTATGSAFFSTPLPTLSAPSKYWYTLKPSMSCFMSLI